METAASQETMFTALKKHYSDGAAPEGAQPQHFGELQDQIKLLRELRAEEAAKQGPPDGERSKKVAAALAKLTQARAVPLRQLLPTP